MRDDLELVIAQDIDSALVVGQCIVEGYLVWCEASFFTPLTGVPDFFRQRNQFL